MKIILYELFNLFNFDILNLFKYLQQLNNNNYLIKNTAIGKKIVANIPVDVQIKSKIEEHKTYLKYKELSLKIQKYLNNNKELNLTSIFIEYVFKFHLIEKNSKMYNYFIDKIQNIDGYSNINNITKDILLEIAAISDDDLIKNFK